MTITMREQRILASMKTFRKPAYSNSAMLDELLAFEKEVVRVTFAEEHSENLRFCDVMSHLAAMDAEAGGVATEQIENLRKISGEVEQLIATGLSGGSGEKKVFQALRTLQCPNSILRNVELTVAGQKCEIDFIVITPKVVFCLEVKNTKYDTLLDENGNLVRASDKKMYDSNLGNAVRQREYLLRSLFSCSDCLQRDQPPEIKTYVVSANPRITFTNDFPYIDSYCVTRIPYIIDAYYENYCNAEEDMNLYRHAINMAWEVREYPIRFDVDTFRLCFANIVATLEFEKDKENACESQVSTPVSAKVVDGTCTRTKTESSKPSRVKQYLHDTWHWLITSQVPRYVGCACAGVLTGSAITAIRKR